MKLHILENTVANGVPVAIGERIETNDHDGALLCAMGRARVATVETATARPAIETATVSKNRTAKTAAK